VKRSLERRLDFLWPGYQELQHASPILPAKSRVPFVLVWFVLSSGEVLVLGAGKLLSLSLWEK